MGGATSTITTDSVTTAAEARAAAARARTWRASTYRRPQPWPRPPQPPKPRPEPAPEPLPAEAHSPARAILRVIAAHYSLEVEDIMRDGGRKGARPEARAVAVAAIREALGWSYPRIAAYLGGLDHSTAVHAHQRVRASADLAARAALAIEEVRPWPGGDRRRHRGGVSLHRDIKNVSDHLFRLFRVTRIRSWIPQYRQILTPRRRSLHRRPVS